jgi:hypothetical protein
VGLALLGAAAVVLPAEAFWLLAASLRAVMESNRKWSDPQACTWTILAGGDQPRRRDRTIACRPDDVYLFRTGGGKRENVWLPQHAAIVEALLIGANSIRMQRRRGRIVATDSPRRDLITGGARRRGRRR